MDRSRDHEVFIGSYDPEEEMPDPDRRPADRWQSDLSRRQHGDLRYGDRMDEFERDQERWYRNRPREEEGFLDRARGYMHRAANAIRGEHDEERDRSDYDLTWRRGERSPGEPERYREQRYGRGAERFASGRDRDRDYDRDYGRGYESDYDRDWRERGAQRRWGASGTYGEYGNSRPDYERQEYERDYERSRPYRGYDRSAGPSPGYEQKGRDFGGERGYRGYGRDEREEPGRFEGYDTDWDRAHGREFGPYHRYEEMWNRDRWERDRERAPRENRMGEEDATYSVYPYGRRGRR